MSMPWLLILPSPHQGELSPDAVRIDGWASNASLDHLLSFALPASSSSSAPKGVLGVAAGEAQFRGALLAP